MYAGSASDACPKCKLNVELVADSMSLNFTAAKQIDLFYVL